MIVILFLSGCSYFKQQSLIIKKINMNLTSTAFTNNSILPSQYACDGAGFNPPLQISEVPTNAQSLVLIMDDPDAPAGTYVHWLVWNIDPQTKEILSDSLPNGAISGTNSAGRTDYVPPCPPSGSHRYIFKLYALDTKIDLTPNAGKDNLEQSMQGHVLDSVELIGLYSRQ